MLQFGGGHTFLHGDDKKNWLIWIFVGGQDVYTSTEPFYMTTSSQSLGWRQSPLTGIQNMFWITGITSKM